MTVENYLVLIFFDYHVNKKRYWGGLVCYSKKHIIWSWNNCLNFKVELNSKPFFIICAEQVWPEKDFFVIVKGVVKDI